MGTDHQSATNLDLEQIKQTWDRIAYGYDKTNTPVHQWLGDEGLKRVNLQTGLKFLDVAAGTGALSLPAARLGARVFAIDLSPAMLKLLEKNASREGYAIEIQVMDGHALELEDNSFDMAGSQFGVMLFPDMPRGIREMVRVVKPGGRVLLTVYGDPRKIEFLGFLVKSIQSVRPEFTGPPLEPPPLPFQLQNPQKLAFELGNAGLKDIRVETITEHLSFRTGKQLWEWLLFSNPMVESVLAELQLSSEDRSVVQQALERLVEERAGTTATAILTNPINIGVGTK